MTTKVFVAEAVNPSQCPLCGQANQCAMDKERTTGDKQAPCWCLNASFSESLLARVPKALRNRACICATCASNKVLEY